MQKEEASEKNDKICHILNKPQVYLFSRYDNNNNNQPVSPFDSNRVDPISHRKRSF